MNIVKHAAESIVNALSAMNSSFGRGNVVKVEIDGPILLEGESIVGNVIRRIPITQNTGRIEKRKFRVQNGKITYLGHTKTLK